MSTHKLLLATKLADDSFGYRPSRVNLLDVMPKKKKSPIVFLCLSSLVLFDQKKEKVVWFLAPFVVSFGIFSGWSLPQEVEVVPGQGILEEG